MKKSLFALIAATGLAAASAVQAQEPQAQPQPQAVTSPWTASATHNTVYTDGSTASVFLMPPAGVSTSAKITHVEGRWNPYPNGNTHEEVQICYAQPSSSVYGDCVNISTRPTFNLSNYAGQSARGSFAIRHTLTGGSYPATGSGVKDSISVYFQ
jgi:hypothetical protein